ncbi:hypothetical protein ACFW1M_11755 [Streptomyces inhibens]|uniref:hypothetical protein n=1 Tax=Streptomyces inhibens TaxID=2293571 RepID=UPI0036A2F094
MDRTQHKPPTTPAPLAALLTTAAAVIDANPHMRPDAEIGPRFIEGVLTLITRRLIAPAAAQYREAEHTARAAATNLYVAQRDGATPTTIRAAHRHADETARRRNAAAKQVAAAERAAAATTAAALDALGPLPTGTTRAQLSAAMRRTAVAAPALTGATR